MLARGRWRPAPRQRPRARRLPAGKPHLRAVARARAAQAAARANAAGRDGALGGHCACPCSLHRQRRAPILGSPCSPDFSGAFSRTGGAQDNVMFDPTPPFIIISRQKVGTLQGVTSRRCTGGVVTLALAGVLC